MPVCKLGHRQKSGSSCSTWPSDLRDLPAPRYHFIPPNPQCLPVTDTSSWPLFLPLRLTRATPAAWLGCPSCHISPETYNQFTLPGETCSSLLYQVTTDLTAADKQTTWDRGWTPKWQKNRGNGHPNPAIHYPPLAQCELLRWKKKVTWRKRKDRKTQLTNWLQMFRSQHRNKNNVKNPNNMSPPKMSKLYRNGP